MDVIEWDRRTLEGFGLGLFIFALIWPTLYSLLAFFPNTIDAAVRNSIFNATFARSFLVASFAGGCAVCALVEKFGWASIQGVIK